MPIYVYVCEQCRESQEVFLRSKNQEAPKECSCGGRLEQAVTVPSVVFRGNGFHKNDYRS